MKKLTVLIAFLLITSIVKAQEVDIVKLEITNRQLLGGDKNLFMIGFWVQQEEFTGISQKSKVLSFVDDTGFDILEAHQKISQQLNPSGRETSVTEKAKRLIVFNESRLLPDNKGFLLVMRSWALPKKNAKEILLKAEIVFNILESDSLETATIENLVFRDVTSLPWQGSTIPVSKKKYNDSVKGDQYRYRLNNEDWGVRVQKIEQLHVDGNVFKEIELSLFPDRTEFSLRQTEIDKPMTLKISYKKLSNKKIIIDKKIDLGL